MIHKLVSRVWPAHSSATRKKAEAEPATMPMSKPNPIQRNK